MGLKRGSEGAKEGQLGGAVKRAIKASLLGAVDARTRRKIQHAMEMEPRMPERASWAVRGMAAAARLAMLGWRDIRDAI